MVLANPMIHDAIIAVPWVIRGPGCPGTQQDVQEHNKSRIQRIHYIVRLTAHCTMMPSLPCPGWHAVQDFQEQNKSRIQRIHYIVRLTVHCTLGAVCTFMKHAHSLDEQEAYINSHAHGLILASSANATHTHTHTHTHIQCSQPFQCCNPLHWHIMN